MTRKRPAGFADLFWFYLVVTVLLVIGAQIYKAGVPS